MLLCQHEEIAVQIAHGYAKATGRPMAVILHDLVGLLHATMAIYYAYIDRVPVFIMGATGPMHEGKRRPHIDWTHSALVQGNAVRDYVKWDYQPTSIEGVPESFARAYSVMTTEPQGPIYMCYDAMLQEEPLLADVPLPPKDAAATPATMMPDPAALAAIADRLLAAEHPLLLAEYVGRRAGRVREPGASSPRRSARRCGTSTARSTFPTGIRCASAWTRRPPGAPTCWSASTCAIGRSR